MRTTDTVIIGAGQAGLAASRCLTDRGHDHVVLDRGGIGQRWRTCSWDSLHLLTPNWMNGLPGRPYAGPDPDGFAPAAAFTDQLAEYARSFAAPVEEHADVSRLRLRGNDFEVVTGAGTWRARHVVMATGWCDRPAIPALARSLTAHQVTPAEYRNPRSLPPGGVLVVGASATGVQLADELRSAGRDVTIAAGSHTRMERSHLGRDIYWWLARLGVLDRTIDEMPDPVRARREPSPQLAGRVDRIDLTTLQAKGVQLVGRVLAADGHRVRLSPDLPSTIAAADQRWRRLLDRIDAHAGTRSSERTRTTTPARVISELDLRRAGIRTVLWATGHRRSHPWLRIPVLDRHGEIRQHRGRTPAPGLYVLGQRFQHHRSSNFIGGVGRDAAFVADHITGRHAHA
ncbi:pyridine nucleotide-disulfide oxidoreductase [Lentzea tibetensis]|uniref:Pyridine nucleotide-disulfide oxidoreductase n=1 Tax=Lentzea tibetensis TaxID=2591470 RepID=A0A563ESB5_9PSEU|nr:NAD(P)/FAD-dependent oxidoreductase [Lentzea tibetensis]TWP50492.1 pyridine nucleotide-disulfide oxidoreductase [Lentzea tibetensis]